MISASDNRGLTITNDSPLPLRLSYKRQRNVGEFRLPAAVEIKPGQTMFVVDPPRGVSVVLHRRAPMRMRVVGHVRDFADLAERVYGDDWQQELAKRSGRHIKAVRRWLSGTTPVPGPVLAMVEAEAKVRHMGAIP